MDLRVLGPVEAVVDDHPVVIGAGKPRALLAMLALSEGSRVSSEALIDGLWGEAPPATAPKIVQVYVSQLRKVLGVGGNGAEIVTRGRGYELRLGDGELDVRRFERLVAEGLPREALALWRGPPLDDVATEPFAALEIRRLEELRLAAVEMAIDQDLAMGRHAEIVGELETLVAQEPLRERLHALRMLALYRSGRQAAALEAYRRARKALVDEVGVEPGPELRRLHEAILRQDPALDPPAEDPAELPPSGKDDFRPAMATNIAHVARAELLERADELDGLDAALTAVTATRTGRLVFVGGEAGVGKTTLLRRFAADAPPTARVLWGACDALFTPRALGPLLDVAEATAGELEELVAGEARPHDVVSALVRELRTRKATILVLEDVQWADEATLDVLRLLSRKLDGTPALVLATYRDDELDVAHPLRLVLGEVATRPAFERMTVAPLSAAAVATLAESHTVDVAALHSVTGGNPFFVTEVLAGSGDRIPATVRDAVLARAARLSGEARRLLEAVAVVPREAELWLLEALVGDGMDRLEEALASGVLAPAASGVGFRHELARRAIEESLAPNRRVWLHQRAFVALTGRAEGQADLARLAHHAEAAGDRAAVLRFAPAAADRAAELGAHREAAAHYARALRFAGAEPPDVRAALLERHAQECFLIDASDDAITALEAAIALHRERGDERSEAVALTALSNVLWCPGRIEHAVDASRRAIAMLERDHPSRELAMACCGLAQLLKDAEDADGTRTWATRALELADQLGDVEVRLNASITLGAVTALRGDEEGRVQIDRAMRVAAEAGLHEAIGRAWVHLAWIEARRRDYDACDAAIAAGLDHCHEHGLDLHALYLTGYRASWLLDQGRWSDAVASAEEVLRRTGVSRLPRVLALVVTGLVRARRGETDARETLDEALAIAQPTGELQRIGPAAAACAEAAWLQGDVAGVDAATAGPIELAARRGAGWVVGELAGWRLHAGLPCPCVPAAATPYAAQQAGDWASAAAFWEARGCPYEAALARAGGGEERALRVALDALLDLEAAAAAAIVVRRLRVGAWHINMPAFLAPTSSPRPEAGS
jgi:DNA-binding SARP family transcriptional activator/tetratricopeptide (TPR) repeat protein